MTEFKEHSSYVRSIFHWFSLASWQIHFKVKLTSAYLCMFSGHAQTRAVNETGSVRDYNAALRADY